MDCQQDLFGNWGKGERKAKKTWIKCTNNMGHTMIKTRETNVKINLVSLEFYQHACHLQLRSYCGYACFKIVQINPFIVGNPNRKKMHIFGFVGIFEYICKTTFNKIFSMYTKP